MSCCSHSQSAGKFFSFFAPRYCRRFKKKGFEPSQKHLIEGLDFAGFSGLSILEIGCGVGHLHQTLIEKGAASATGIDLSDGMLKEASAWAKARNLEIKTNYIQGDFMDLADQVKQHEVTILDKVLCCYPDAEGLIQKSILKTEKVYAVTYPRNRFFARLFTFITGLVLGLFGSDFRNYIHDPEQIEHWIKISGFKKKYENKTFIWLTQVYTR